LSSTCGGDKILDPFAGTGTTAIVANQLDRNSVSIEIDSANVGCIDKRLMVMRKSDQIEKFYKDYICTDNLNVIWGKKNSELLPESKQAAVFSNL